MTVENSKVTKQIWANIGVCDRNGSSTQLLLGNLIYLLLRLNEFQLLNIMEDIEEALEENK